MRKIELLGLLGAWLGFASICSAQMSTFPSPPPLAPPSKSDTDSDSATNNSSAIPASPDTSVPSQPGAGIGTGASSPPEAATVDSNNPVPVAAGILSSMSALDDKIPLHKGDRISFRVIEDKDLAVPRIVTDTGEVDFPYVGRVKVEGQTCHQVAVELKRLLEVDYYKRATVIVGLDTIADQPSDKVEVPKDVAWIVGQVRQVGPQELSKTQPITVSQIILRAGGFGDFADQRKVKIVHRSSPTAPPVTDTQSNTASIDDMEIVDVKAVYDAQSKVDPIVKPNDYIIVPKRAVNF